MRRPRGLRRQSLVIVIVVVMVIVVPVLMGVPAMRIRIPPAVIAAPAVFAGVVKFVAGALGLSTVGAMMVDRFVQMMRGPFGAPLAAVSPELRRAEQHHESGESRSSERELRMPGSRSFSHL